MRIGLDDVKILKRNGKRRKRRTIGEKIRKLDSQTNQRMRKKRKRKRRRNFVVDAVIKTRVNGRLESKFLKRGEMKMLNMSQKRFERKKIFFPKNGFQIFRQI